MRASLVAGSVAEIKCRCGVLNLVVALPRERVERLTLTVDRLVEYEVVEVDGLRANG